MANGKCSKCSAACKRTKAGWLCRECKSKSQKEYAKRRRERGLTGGGSMPKSWWSNYHKEYMQRPGVLERQAERAKKYRNDPDLRVKHKARWLVARAVQAGRLVKTPCQKCGEAKVEGHHVDYSKPLEVIWLCQGCHRDEHLKAGGQ